MVYVVHDTYVQYGNCCICYSSSMLYCSCMLYKPHISVRCSVANLQYEYYTFLEEIKCRKSVGDRWSAGSNVFDFTKVVPVMKKPLLYIVHALCCIFIMLSVYSIQYCISSYLLFYINLICSAASGIYNSLFIELGSFLNVNDIGQ